MDETLVALTRERAAVLAGVTDRQIDYWSRTGLIHPAVDRRLTPQRPVRLYGYVELMSLLVTAELIRRGVSLQHIRRIVEHLRSAGYPRPLTEVTFATEEGTVYFQTADGVWAGGAVPGQLVFHQVLHLEPLRARIRDATRRSTSDVGSVARRRGTMGGKPLLAGTRVPVATVRRYLERGATTAEVLEAFPILREPDIEVVRRELTVA